MIQWNLHQPDYLLSIANGEGIILQHQDKSVRKVGGLGSTLSYADWMRSSSTPFTAATANNAGNIVIHHPSGEEICYSTKRTCNSLAWNATETSHLAIGMEASKGVDSSLHIWDVQHESILKLPAAESCHSLQWLDNTPHLLLLGNAMGAVKLYDTRSNSSQAMLAIQAHPSTRPRKVRGIRCNAESSIHLLTFSDVPGDLLKLWDLRVARNLNSVSTSAKGGSSTASQPVYSIAPYLANTGTAVGSILDVSWSPHCTWQTAVVTSCSMAVSLWRFDSAGVNSEATASASTTPSAPTVNEPLVVYPLNEYPRCISWLFVPRSSSSSDADIQELLGGDQPASLTQPQPHGEAVWEACRQLDHSQHPLLNLPAIAETRSSGKGGLLAVGLASGVLVLPNSSSLHETASPCIHRTHHYEQDEESQKGEDILQYLSNSHVLMKDRAEAGYGLEAEGNLLVLEAEMAVLAPALLLDDDKYNNDVITNESSNNADKPQEESYQEAEQENIFKQFEARQQRQLQREECRRHLLELHAAWVWVDRLESELRDQALAHWSSCGALSILTSSTSSSSSSSSSNTATGTSASTSTSSGNTSLLYDEGLGAYFHRSRERELIRKACGWKEEDWRSMSGAMKAIKLRKISDEGAMEMFVHSPSDFSAERAAATELWHGLLPVAVTHLLDAARRYREDPIKGGLLGEGEVDRPMDERHVHLLEMTATCLAAYPPQAHPDVGDTIESSSQGHSQASAGNKSAWRKQCDRLLSLLSIDEDSQNSKKNRRATGYLSAALTFLATNEIVATRGKVAQQVYLDSFLSADETRLAVEDQVAFAATYLDDASLQQWLKGRAQKAADEGRLAGLLLTGLSPQGLKLLQRYVDRTDDIQSAALIAVRLLRRPLFAPAPTIQAQQTAARLYGEYRRLLGSVYNLQQERVLLDTAAAAMHASTFGQLFKLERERAAGRSGGSGSGAASNRNSARMGGGQTPSKQSGSTISAASGKAGNTPVFLSAAEVLHPSPPNQTKHEISATAATQPLPASLRIQCLCGADLPVLRLVDLTLPSSNDTGGQAAMAVLRKLPASLRCCPSCGARQALPVCWLCRTGLELVNPYGLIERLIQHEDRKTGQKYSDLAPRDMQKWTVMCTKCRHGGHHDCMHGWFRGTAEGVIRNCGVAGCDCHCLFE